MSSSNKSGRKPISNRRRLNPFIATDDVFGNPLALDENLKKELKEHNLAWRFVDAKKLYEMGGYHDKGWVPFKRKSIQNASIGTAEFKFGSDPEGIVRRGSLILAVKTAEQAERHRSYLRMRAERYSDPAKLNHEKAEELKRLAAKESVNLEVHEGYEENKDQE